MWGSFYANVGKGAFKGNFKTKLKLIDRAVQPVLTYRCPRWPFVPTRAAKLDKLQDSMTARIMKIPGRPGESRSAYWQRVHRSAAAVNKSRQRWSDLWRTRVKLWGQHLSRHPDSWSKQLIDYHDESWLAQRRSIFASGPFGILAGRTDTRCIRQKVHQRWQKGLIQCYGWEIHLQVELGWVTFETSVDYSALSDSDSDSE